MYTYFNDMTNEEMLSTLFNIKYRTDDSILDYIIEEFTHRGFVADEVHDNDSNIVLKFSNSNTVGEFTIDRFRKEFSIFAKVYDENIFPVFGEYSIVLSYLDKLQVLSSQKIAIGN